MIIKAYQAAFPEYWFVNAVFNVDVNGSQHVEAKSFVFEKSL